MLRLKRWIAVFLTVCIGISSMPVYAFAAEPVVEPLVSTETIADIPADVETTPAAAQPTEEKSSMPSEQATQPQSETTMPEETLPEETLSEETLPEETLPEETLPEETLPEETLPEETLPEETLPEETLPEETLPEETLPEETLPEETLPEETLPEQTLPQETLPEEALADEAEALADDPAVKAAEDFKAMLREENLPEACVQIQGVTVTLTVSEGDETILKLLSKFNQADDSNYQNWNIALASTGALTLPEGYSGLGSDDFPFKGKFTNQAITLNSSQTIFKALHATAYLNGVQINWTGSPDQPILAKTLVADSEYREIKMPLASASSFSPYIGTLTGGEGIVSLPTLDYSSAKQEGDTKYPGDVGLICGSMATGTKLQINTLHLPESAQLKLSSTGNAGGLVGSMDSEAELILTQDVTLDAVLNGQNAGGLVGSAANARIRLNGCTATVSAELTASKAAGGLVGAAVTQTGPVIGNVVLRSVTAKGNENSGVLYGTCTATGDFNPLAGVSFADDAAKSVSGSGSCGGVFGTLTLQGDGKCTLTDQKISSTLADVTKSTGFGGVAGTLSGARKNALVVKNCTIISEINVGTDPEKYPKYIGGIVATQHATLDAKSSTVIVNSPRTAKESDRGFGGVSAYVNDGAILIAEAMTIESSPFYSGNGNGGVAGSAHEGSIIYLKGSLDLSKCELATNISSGQIVGSQDCSLVYAPGVAIKRLQNGKYTGLELDDIGNYGELYRVDGFLTVNETTYEPAFALALSKTGEEYVLSSVQNYACLALAWQSRGVFPTVDGITTSNWSDLKSCTIRLSAADLNLTGCGIGGLTRDVSSAEDTFAGEFYGDNHTITLAVGGQNTSDDAVTKGDGRIYWHNATGLFAVLSGVAKVENLTLAGSVRLSNSKVTTGQFTKMASGGLAANMSGGTVNNVSTAVAYNVYGYGDKQLYVGGLVGLISDTRTTIPQFTLNSDTNLEAAITVFHYKNGNVNYIGGVIGAIEANANVNIVCDGATLAGEITYTNTSNDTSNIYAGGLVGTIFPSNSATRTIALTDLKVDGFTLTGSAKERMGGILGGIWADTDVTVDGLKVSNTTLTAKGTAALGGLVYRASGKWTVTSADLSGLTIVAQDADALGLLVCKGGPDEEPINGNKKVGGLYLEMAAHWDWNGDTKKGYHVPENITFDNEVFDEFVAYTAYRYTDGSYDITHNGSGIISLKTDNGTINMTEGNRNTYVNRTTVGQSKQTNLYSRYYYNLPEVKAPCDGGNINTPEELLIWSVYRYAASNLQKNFAIDNVTAKTIGGTSSTSKANFDMKGLSYYPISITNESVTVQYADVKFYNNEIEAMEEGNKSTRGTTADHTQHYTMHCALFLDFAAELANTTIYANRTMTVNGVNFAGSVGMVNGGSGALLCGTVKGDTRGGNTSVCTVILADADNGDKAVSLNGLSVAPAGEYTPVLINKIDSYAGLKANYITATEQQKMTAGSSLIGDVGGQNANNVTMEFAGTIKLPETDVFTKAILLNSLRYANGSATYHFYKSKDYEGANYVHNATHGRELSTTVEYTGKQGCYYDGYGTGYFVSKNGNFDALNDFSTYLPYVALSPATKDEEHTLANRWHELAVNVLSADLTEGCGTYGHPYQVDANLLKEAANFINTGIPTDGWLVRFPTDSTYHGDTESHDVLLKYSAGGWKEVTEAEPETLGEDAPAPRTYSIEAVRKHLQSAYFEIKENIELSDFEGIGTKDFAFTGVMKGKDAGTMVKLTSGSTAFVKYSYGCVIRDLNIVLDQSPTLNRDTWTRGYAEQAPKTFFGGVIGCVLGGDNIINNVTVNGSALNLTLTGSNTHLVPVGGYVGVIAGGGVLFRGNCSSSTGITGTDAQLYQNPIIGRVLGGYAFYEESGTAPDNGDKNYKINKIAFTTPDLSWNGSKVTVNNAQGLLVLSAIVSSGAGSTSSNAYTQGKARNAAYDHIGETVEPTDYTLAKQDAGTVWQAGQTPYLLHKYAGYTGSSGICTSGTGGIAIAFAGGTFDMAGYGNGYRGLSARYVSNAAFTTGSSVAVNVPNVIMRVSSFDGQNTTVQNINMDVKEYADDDFHAASVGGIFNIIWTKKQSGGTETSVLAQNLTLQDCNVQLQYVDSRGNKVNVADANTLSVKDGRYCVSVGGFIGMANDIDASDTSQKTTQHNYLFTNIHIKGTVSTNKCEIYGPNGVGGLIGTTAMASTAVDGYPGILLANKKWSLFGPSFLNCSYSNIAVTGGMAAGGLIGDAYASAIGSEPGFSGLGISYGNKAFLCYASCTVTDKDLTVGADSVIKTMARGSIAAGIFGAAGMRVSVNDPDVASADKTNLPIEGSPQTLRLSNVEVLVSQDGFDAPSSPDSGANNAYTNNAYAGGIIARIGSENPVCFYDISITGGQVSSKIATASYVGGIVGSGYTNKQNTMERCHIDNLTVSGVYAGGFLGRGHSAPGFTLYMTDCSIRNSNITATNSGYAGGVVGSAASSYYLFNILLKNTSITGGYTGRLFGLMNINANGDDLRVNAAGISIYVDPGRTDVKIPEKVGYNKAGKNYNGFIVSADYLGTETEVTGKDAPYVTVNPNYTLAGANKTLTGDAVGKIADDGSVAARIWADQKDGATDKKNLASYFRVTNIVNANKAPTVSTFHAEQGRGPDDLPVLIPNSMNAVEIENYLDVITNGGYSEAGSNVKLSVSVYYWNDVEKTFAEADAAKLNSEPASVYLDSGNKLYIRSTSFDNTRNRFTLVEASFEVTVNGKKCTYTVSVPVIIKRQLQYNFIATFSYGAEFHAETFNSLKNHVLESTGNPFTAYVTYEYNRDATEYVEYDWQSYMDGGGSMLGVDKVLNFSSGLPDGTQLILVDPQNGGLAYQYSTEGTTTNKVYLSKFTAVSDDKPFQSSMAEILGVECTPHDSGKYVETNSANATVRLKDGNGGYVYYRPLDIGETTTNQRYTLTVPDLSKVKPEENYYVVINVPKQTSEDFYLNGFLKSELNWSMPSKSTNIHRYNNEITKNNNDETTYQISSGYQQKLESTAVKGTPPIDLGDANKNMQVQVKDTITFSNRQTYDSNDKLYLKFTVTLQEHTSGSSEVSEIQFPSSTSGTVRFYIQDTDGQYFTLSDGTWISQAEKTEAGSYLWISKGADMELPLSADGTTLLDLSGVRQLVKGSKDAGDSQIIVTAQMDIDFSSIDVIPGSDQAGADRWAQLHYVGQISTQEFSLDYSSARASADDNATYFRSVKYEAILSMDAASINQLGINPLQLVPSYLRTRGGKQASVIDLTAALNLADLQDIEGALESTKKITFTLSLLRRSGDTYVVVQDPKDYISFDTPNGFEWSWTFDQKSYYQDGKLRTNDIFDGSQFTIPLKAYVFIGQKDYANYKIQLDVSFESGDITIPVSNNDAYVVYTFACIKPTFYDPTPKG